MLGTREFRYALALAAVLLLAPGQAALAGAKIALVIGNSAYQNATPLINADKDGRAMAAKLRGLGFEVLEGIDQTHDQMVSTIRQMARRLPGVKEAVFFYAGHGMQVAGENYLVPIDANLEQEADLAFETIKVQTVLEIMESEQRTNIVFLDACRNNPMAQTLARSLSRTRSAAFGKGLAQLDAGLGTLITYSTQPNNVALDGDPSAANSPFTTALLNHIGTPGLEIRQALTRVRQEVVDATNGQQVPWDHSSLLGDFYFGPEDKPQVAALTDDSGASAGPTPTPPATGNQDSLEVEYWKTIQKIESPAHKTAALNSYLERYPDGSFTDLARMELGALTERSLAPAEPTIDLTPLDETMVVARDANIRGGPSTDNKKIATLRAGSKVAVVGHIEESNWFKLDHPRHGETYIFGKLLVSQEDWTRQQAAKTAAQKAAAKEAAAKAAAATQSANAATQSQTTRTTSQSGGTQSSSGQVASAPAAVRVRNLAGVSIDPGVIEVMSDNLRRQIGPNGLAKLRSASIDILIASADKTANSGFEGAKIAQSLFGGIVPNLPVSKYNLTYRAEVRVELIAKDGRQWRENGKRERVDDSDRVNGGIFVQNLMDAADAAGGQATGRMASDTQ